MQNGNKFHAPSRKIRATHKTWKDTKNEKQVVNKSNTEEHLHHDEATNMNEQCGILQIVLKYDEPGAQKAIYECLDQSTASLPYVRMLGWLKLPAKDCRCCRQFIDGTLRQNASL